MLGLCSWMATCAQKAQISGSWDYALAQGLRGHTKIWSDFQLPLPDEIPEGKGNDGLGPRPIYRILDLPNRPCPIRLRGNSLANRLLCFVHGRGHLVKGRLSFSVSVGRGQGSSSFVCIRMMRDSSDGTAAL